MRYIKRTQALAMVIAAALCSPAIAASSHSQFIKYPAFVNRDARIEVIHDKGLVSELVVNCGGGNSGILTRSHIDGLVCGPKHRCVKDLAEAVRRLCR